MKKVLFFAFLALALVSCGNKRAHDGSTVGLTLSDEPFPDTYFDFPVRILK